MQRPAGDVEPDRLQQIALGDGCDRTRDLVRRPEQVVDQRVDRALHFAPGAACPCGADALAHIALAADHLADMLELLGQLLVGADDVIECIGDLAEHAIVHVGQANREITASHRLERGQ